MSDCTYHFGKIHDAISDPKGDRAHMIDYHIDAILDEFKNSDSIGIMNQIAEELKNYVDKNLNSKFKTRDYARQLVSNWKQVCGEY